MLRVSVNQRGVGVLVPHPFPHRFKLGPVLQRMGTERMTKRVRSYRLDDACNPPGFSQFILHRVWRDVPAVAGS